MGGMLQRKLQKNDKTEQFFPVRIHRFGEYTIPSDLQHQQSNGTSAFKGITMLKKSCAVENELPHLGKLLN